MDDVLDDAAWFVPAGDTLAIARAAETLLADTSARDDFGRRGYEHACRFSWESAAAETVEVYREAVRG